MLQKRIDLGSIPYGLATAGEDIKKGSAVIVKYTDNGENGVEAFLPTTEEEANAVKGFATFRIETNGGADTEHDVIKKGDWVVIYTLVKNNIWGTTEFVGDVKKGDELVVGYNKADENGDAGKLRVKTGEETSRETQFKVFNVNEAGVGYTEPMIDVEVM